MTTAGTQPGTGRIGILGSGQLGRMIAIAAAQLGIDTHQPLGQDGCRLDELMQLCLDLLRLLRCLRV